MDEKYISVTKFKETLAKLTVEGGTEATKTTIARTLGKVVPKLLDDEPFADVQPVKHGTWEMHSDYPDKLICSHCKSTCDGYFCERDTMKYCPNCGTRMDLEDGDTG